MCKTYWFNTGPQLYHHHHHILNVKKINLLQNKTEVSLETNLRQATS